MANKNKTQGAEKAPTKENKPKSVTDLGKIIYDNEGNVMYKDKYLGAIACGEFPYENDPESFARVLEWRDNTVQIFMVGEDVIIVEFTPDDYDCYTLSRTKFIQYIVEGERLLALEAQEGEE